MKAILFVALFALIGCGGGGTPSIAPTYALRVSGDPMALKSGVSYFVYAVTADGLHRAPGAWIEVYGETAGQGVLSVQRNQPNGEATVSCDGPANYRMHAYLNGARIADMPVRWVP